MNRTYTADFFINRIQEIQEMIPQCAITTDIICGFPGETEYDFAETVNLVRKIGFSRIHPFSYSPRKGTPAAKMKEQIPENIKKERVKTLAQLNIDLQEEFARTFIHTAVECIPERIDPSTGLLHGYTAHYCQAAYSGESTDIGRIIPLTVTDSNSNMLKGIKKTSSHSIS